MNEQITRGGRPGDHRGSPGAEPAPEAAGRQPQLEQARERAVLIQLIKLRRAVTTGRPARCCWQKGMRHDHTDDSRLSRVEKLIPVDKDERGFFRIPQRQREIGE